jgi:hypothetical protein
MTNVLRGLTSGQNYIHVIYNEFSAKLCISYTHSYVEFIEIVHARKRINQMNLRKKNIVIFGMFKYLLKYLI